MDELVERYRKIDINNPQSLVELMELRQLLVIRAYEVGKKEAIYKRKFDRYYFLRKKKYFSKSMEYAKSMSVAKAELYAENDISELREQEKENEGNYHAAKIIRSQANEMLESIRQDISTLKQEKDES